MSLRCSNCFTLLGKLMDRNIQQRLVKLSFPYLNQRSQCVRAGNGLSRWMPLKRTITQGSWHGLFTLLVHIDDLNIDSMIYKYVDGTIITESISSRLARNHPYSTCKMWAADNDMAVNSEKTREMILGPISKTSKLKLFPLHTEAGGIGQVNSFKLLGLYLYSNFSCASHIQVTLSKATQRP